MILNQQFLLQENILVLFVELCYIAYAMDFRFVPSDPLYFDKLSRCD